jgi:hypothetical protein
MSNIDLESISDILGSSKGMSWCLEQTLVPK